MNPMTFIFAFFGGIAFFAIVETIRDMRRQKHNHAVLDLSRMRPEHRRRLREKYCAHRNKER